MPLFTFIDKLRAKPAPVKKKVALIVSGFLTLIIVFFWGASFTTQPRNGMTIRDTLTPLEGLLHSFSTVADVTKETMASLKESAASSLGSASSSSSASATVVISPASSPGVLPSQQSGTTTFSQ